MIILKNVLYRSTSILINLIEGAITVLSIAISYSFIFETDNIDHDTGLGIFILLVWLLIMLVPNLILKLYCKFHRKDIIFFQLIPFLLGTVIFITYQLWR